MKSAPTLSLLQRLRNNFLTGLIVVAPIGITLYLTWTIVDYVDSTVLPQVLPLIPDDYHPTNLLPFSLPGLGLVVFILFVTFIGGLAKNFFGREVIRVGEGWVEQMPVVRSIYNVLKQITETLFSEATPSFEQACLVEYPRKGLWSIAFIATETRGEVQARSAPGEEMLSIFLPTTPNPTSGYLLFVPARDVIVLDMTIEEAAKLIISAGLITPPNPAFDGDGAESGDKTRAPDHPSGPPIGRAPAVAPQQARRPAL